MKRKLLSIIGLCILMLLSVACNKGNENPISANLTTTTIKPITSEPTKNPSLDKLKNSTPEEAARTLIRSFCENDYNLFLLISKNTSSGNNKERFNSLRRGYDKKNYKEISLTQDKEDKNVFTTFALDSNGDQIIYGKGSLNGEKPSIVKLCFSLSNDDTYYFSYWSRD